MDDGTGHAIIQSIHVLLRDSVGDFNSVNSFSIAPSTHNQQIEAIGRNFAKSEEIGDKIFLEIKLTCNYLTQLLVF